MNKKAYNTIMMIFEILVVILIIALALSIAKKYAESDRVTRINIAEDFAMMVNVLAGTSGEAMVKYSSYNLSGYVVNLKNDVVQVYFLPPEENTDGIKKKEPTEISFVLPAGYQAKGEISKQENACLEKTKQKVILLRSCKDDE